jgi:putative transposase
MTDDKIALRELLEKGSDATFLREMIGFAAERLMALETETLCGAAPGERSAGRTNQRNGYRDRDWHTRAGTVELHIPKLRRGRSYEEVNSGGSLADCCRRNHLWRQICPLRPIV